MRVIFFLPAHGDVAVLRVVRRRARFEIGNIEVGQGVVDEAVHGPRLAEHVLVDQSRDEVRCEGDDEGLQRKRTRNPLTNKRLAARLPKGALTGSQQCERYWTKMCRTNVCKCL